MRFVEFANQVWDIPVDYENLGETALLGIQVTEEYFRSLGMPITIPDLLGRSLTAQEIDQLSQSCVHFGKRTISTFKVLNKSDVAAIYEMANH